MPRKSLYDEDYDYDEDEYDDPKKGLRRIKKEQTGHDKKKQWEREEVYNRDHDYDERR